MRRKSTRDYKSIAFLSKKIIGADNSVSYSDTYIKFKYGNYQGKKTVFTEDEDTQNFQSTDATRKIITNSPIKFKRDDRVYINNERYIITMIEVESDPKLKYAAIRNRPNRDNFIITLS